MPELGRIDRKSFDAIQREQSRRSVLLFGILALLYLLGVMLTYLPIRWLLAFTGRVPPFGWKDILLVVVIGAIAAGTHWILARASMLRRILEVLRARAVDPADVYHQRLVRVVDELRVAAGLPEVQCVVIPTSAANAFAAEVPDRPPVIGVTEGLLSRLSRPQLQAVCAHEVAHVLRHDSRLATLVCAMCGVFLEMAESQTARHPDGQRVISPLYPLFLLLYWIALALNLAISRNREYLADATAVQLTRDPLALADALQRIGRAPRGVAAQGLSPLFIAGNDWEESNGSAADLFSTHPPLVRRVANLLETAGMSPGRARHEAREPGKDRQHQGTMPARYYAFDDGERQWVGPLAPAELSTMDWIGPATWVAAEGGGSAMALASVALLLEAVHGGQQLSGEGCPRCGVSLIEEDYEGTQVERCARCGGCLVDIERVDRILVRRDATMGPEVQQLASRFRETTRLRPRRSSAGLLVPGLEPPKCPRCSRAMFTTLYSYQHFVEIDRCGSCSVIWFDRDELEILQALVEGVQPEP